MNNTPHNAPLCYIKASDPKAAIEVQQTLGWLMSDQADGLGKELLAKAFALHKKPLQILVTPGHGNGYSDADGCHTLVIDPYEVKHLTLPDKSGTATPVSLARVLAHELVHAGQDGIQMHAYYNSQLRQKLLQEFKAQLSEQQQARETVLQAEMLGAPTYEKATTFTKEFVDSYMLPGNQYVDAQIERDPNYTHYIEKFEKPAIAAGNKVARILGNPERNGYHEGMRALPIEAQRAMLIEEFITVFELDKKPHEQEKRQWKSAVRHPEANTQNRPNSHAANHQDGGRI